MKKVSEIINRGGGKLMDDYHLHFLPIFVFPSQDFLWSVVLINIIEGLRIRVVYQS